MPDAWIRQLGDPTLRHQAAPIVSLNALRAQVQRMTDLLLQENGAGLAATQVGILRRAFVYRVEIDEPVTVLINPTITSASNETTTFVEGCLSFPSIRVTVERPVGVSVRGHDLDGHEIHVTAEGFHASLLQHEIDHLDGILTIDRADAQERRRVMADLSTQAA